MRILILVICIWGGTVNADTYLPYITTEVVDGICLDYESERIPMNIVSKTISGSIAEATRSRGKYAISIDKAIYIKLLDTYRYTLIKFILYHECAHMYLGHIKYFDMTEINPSATILAERNADCLAASWIVKSEGIHRFKSLLIDLPFIGIKSTTDRRYTHIVNCANGI